MGVLLKLLTNHRWYIAPADLKRVISYAIINLQDFLAYQKLNFNVAPSIYIDNFIVIIMAGYTLFHFYIKKYIIKTLSCRSCALHLVL